VFRCLRVAALTFACSVWAALAHTVPARADDAPPAPEPVATPAEPVVPAPPCPGTLDLEARLRGLLAGSACGVPERQLLVTLSGNESVSGTLVVLHDYQSEYVREVRGPSCEEVEAALTLALEIYLDPGEPGDSACAPKADSPGSSSTAAEWPGQDLDPFNLPEPEPLPTRPIIEPQPSALVRAIAQIDSSYAPNVAFGVAAVLRVRLTHQNFFGFTFSHQTAPPFSAANGAVVHATAIALGLGLGQYAPIGTKGEFSLEAGPRFGLLQTGTADAPLWTTAGTIGLGLSANLGVKVTEGLWTGFVAGGVVNVVRARYLSDEGLAWEQPWTGGLLGLYLTGAVPGPPRLPSLPSGPDGR
jgi:hypothetical protein